MSGTEAERAENNRFQGQTDAHAHLRFQGPQSQAVAYPLALWLSLPSVTAVILPV